MNPILLQTIAEMEAGVYDFTKDGKCSNCGKCCSNSLPIAAHEIKAIKRYIEKHHIRAEVRFVPTVKPTHDLVCPFRSDAEKKCTIYPVRPAICRDFQCDKPRKRIAPNKQLYHGKYNIVDMRAEFFGAKGLAEILKNK